MDIGELFVEAVCYAIAIATNLREYVRKLTYYSDENRANNYYIFIIWLDTVI